MPVYTTGSRSTASRVRGCACGGSSSPPNITSGAEVLS
jgi:hypothetical protein